MIALWGRVWSWSQVLLADYPEQGCQGCDKAGLVHLSQGTSSPVWVAECQPTNFLPLCFVDLQGQVEPGPQVPVQDAQQLVLPVQNKTG